MNTVAHEYDKSFGGGIYPYAGTCEAGVTKALEILHKELDMTMALCGHRDIRNVGRAILKNCPF